MASSGMRGFFEFVLVNFVQSPSLMNFTRGTTYRATTVLTIAIDLVTDMQSPPQTATRAIEYSILLRLFPIVINLMFAYTQTKGSIRGSIVLSRGGSSILHK
jgi:hypothetical protein